MIDRQQVLVAVMATIAEYLGEQGEGRLAHDSLLEQDFGLDSTEMVCLAVDLEKKFNIDLKGVKFSNLETPDDVAREVIEVISSSAK
ncbi:hypothetical protein LMG28688_05240 [Paraburkholderia caffeinitolerans]|uniref:Carrier domain-containing protein n=1 Tax=Paraburkholderia caffeinitolerans TaxID=1723730 RepID=A0A6J5GH76_9BURK|nr:acyl carrier protein [Paraburkholderia caffeinitolerans]CAB3800775.1 hypothetical protein LMG28688_05240 [Paraburkholderia caffeinitolerans]